MSSKTYGKCWDLVNKFYRDKGVKLKDELLAHEVCATISSDSRVLDAGCGYNAFLLAEYSDAVATAVGVDLGKDFRVKANIKAVTADLGSLPFADSCFDVILSRDAAEHFRDPLAVFSELSRVLKPGGTIILSTPNKYSYVSFVSRLLSTGIKRKFLKKYFGESGYENFPTFYRCNTEQKIRRIAGNNKLRIVKFYAIRHYPYYFMFSKLLFRIAVLYDQLIDRLRCDFLKSNFLFVLRKESQQ